MVWSEPRTLGRNQLRRRLPHRPQIPEERSEWKANKAEATPIRNSQHHSSNQITNWGNRGVSFPNDNWPIVQNFSMNLLRLMRRGACARRKHFFQWPCHNQISWLQLSKHNYFLLQWEWHTIFCRGTAPENRFVQNRMEWSQDTLSKLREAHSAHGKDSAAASYKSFLPRWLQHKVGSFQLESSWKMRRLWTITISQVAKKMEKKRMDDGVILNCIAARARENIRQRSRQPHSDLCSPASEMGASTASPPWAMAGGAWTEGVGHKAMRERTAEIFLIILFFSEISFACIRR